MSYQTFQGKKVFPVKSQTACMLKWAWSTINFQYGGSASCHRVERDKIDPDNFGEFHNLPGKIKAREAMINGQWPGNGCEYCENVERVGGMSDRMMTLERHHGLDKIPPELFDNPNATSVTPTMVEVYFNNTCNLACAYCDGSISSKINDELRKFGEIQIGDWHQSVFQINNVKYHKMVDGLWKYLAEDQRYKILRHFHILGGETFLQKELEQCFDFWAKHPNPSLTINIITNMMVPHHQFIEKINKVEALVKNESIYMLDLTASLDCWGPQQEYVRYGLDLNLWQKNFEYMLDKEWCNLAIHSCISSLTIKTMPELIEKIKHWNARYLPGREIDHNYDIVVGKGMKLNGLHPANFGEGVFDQDFEKIIERMPNDSEKQKTNKTQMIGQANFIKQSARNPERIAVLQKYLDEIDRRRGTDWRSLFPWLDKNWN
jgi:hypothetical protein